VQLIFFGAAQRPKSQ